MLYNDLNRDLKALNLQQIREQIELINKQLGKFASTDDLKKLQITVESFNTKIEKNTAEIKQIYDIIRELQGSIGRSQPRQSGPSDDQIS